MANEEKKSDIEILFYNDRHSGFRAVICSTNEGFNTEDWKNIPVGEIGTPSLFSITDSISDLTYKKTFPSLLLKYQHFNVPFVKLITEPNYKSADIGTTMRNFFTDNKNLQKFINWDNYKLFANLHTTIFDIQLDKILDFNEMFDYGDKSVSQGQRNAEFQRTVTDYASYMHDNNLNDFDGGDSNAFNKNVKDTCKLLSDRDSDITNCTLNKFDESPFFKCTNDNVLNIRYLTDSFDIVDTSYTVSQLLENTRTALRKTYGDRFDKKSEEEKEEKKEEVVEPQNVEKTITFQLMHESVSGSAGFDKVGRTFTHTITGVELKLPTNTDDFKDLVENFDFTSYSVNGIRHNAPIIDMESFINLINSAKSKTIPLYVKYEDDIPQKYMTEIDKHENKFKNILRRPPLSTREATKNQIIDRSIFDDVKFKNKKGGHWIWWVFPTPPYKNYINLENVCRNITTADGEGTTTQNKRFEIKNLIDGLELLKYDKWVDYVTRLMYILIKRIKYGGIKEGVGIINIKTWFGVDYVKFKSFLNLFKWLIEIKSYEKLDNDTVFGKFKIAFNNIYEKILNDKEIDKTIFDKYNRYLQGLKNKYGTEEIYTIKPYDFWFFLDNAPLYVYRVHILPGDLTQELMNGLIDKNKYTIVENTHDQNAISSELINNITTLKTVDKRWFKFFLTKKSKVTTGEGNLTVNVGTEEKYDQPSPTTPPITPTTPPPSPPPLSPSSSASSTTAVSSSSLKPPVIPLQAESEPDEVDITPLKNLLEKETKIRELDNNDFILEEYGKMLNDFLND
jgi:hypothetical protein